MNTATYQLHYYPGNASLLPHMALREAGAPFELHLVDRTWDAQHGAEYLRLNPNGRIPVLVKGDLVLFGAAAITMHVVGGHPEAGLAPPLGTPERGQFYKWMVHLTNTSQAKYRAWFYPLQHTADPAVADAVKQAAGERLGRMFDIIADQLGVGAWLLGTCSRRPACFCSCWCGEAGTCRCHREPCRRSLTMLGGCSRARLSGPPWWWRTSRSRSSERLAQG